MTTPATILADQQFWLKAEPQPTGCWEWTAGRTSAGYGVVYDPDDRRQRGAHRLAYEAVKGPIPDGYQPDHLCRNRPCINPDHLEAVTVRTNLLRGEGAAAQNARKVRCQRGHPLSGANLYNPPGQPHIRQCRTCKSARHEKRRRRLAFRRALGRIEF